MSKTVDFGKFIFDFVKDTERYQTHLSFNKGKYNVPDTKYDEFYCKYYEAMKSSEELYLIEKVYNSKFRFFLDIDLPKRDVPMSALSDSHITIIVDAAIQAINDIFSSKSGFVTENVISKRQDKYHINFCNLVVDSVTAKTVCDEMCKLLSEHSDTEAQALTKCIDISVYRTGLRLLGSRKGNMKKGKGNEVESEVYRIYNIQSGQLLRLADTDFDTFMKTVVRVKADTEKTALSDKYNSILVKAQDASGKAPIVKGIESNGTAVSKEIVELLQELKMTNECLSGYNMEIERIYATQNKMGMFCYYVSIKQKHCPFKDREHQRPTCPVYLEISVSGVYVKCYDQDCLRRRFPEGGIRLPEDFQTRFVQMYLSMSTKYWTTEVTLTEPIKRCLEESLTGSHYQIAKTAFTIYKSRFRVDDVKNTAWYEYDGVRWNKSHLMNILISEELPKYYRGIKISDTSVMNKNSNLQEFLVNDEKIDANLRNQMVDNIINKLENVNFKNNVLAQVCYLFKTYDSDFYKNLDENPYLVGFKNGIYDFKQNAFRASVQSDYITFSTGYDYVEYDESNQQVQEIYDFLSKIITNKQVREYLLKVLGKSLVGIPDEKFYIWTGLSGANGKSTLVNFLEHTLGDYTTSVDVSLLTNRRANASNASPDIIRLRGRRIFTFQEPEHDDKLRTGILKQYTGGDTIVARELFKAPVTFKLQGTMIMCCNDLPAVSSIDGGTWRRIRVVEFKSRFCENPVKENEFKINPGIKSKIKEWRPYFMSILIHWYNKYLYEGLNEPDEVKKATAKYKVDNDKFNEFFDQCLEESQHFETNKSIYGNFQLWWNSNYPNTKVPDNRELRRAMKIKYGNEREQSLGGTVHYGFNVKVKYECNLQDEIEKDLDDC
uniref:SF3 helicase domain-containing protein n=1 Tax=viral metagenome TaxID=1070528 RepID=A0A6C0H6Y1_9ZZZZ